MKIEVPFAMQEGKGASIQNSQETLINMYAEPDFGRKQLVRRQRPGVKHWALQATDELTIAGTPQGIERHAAIHYFVANGFIRRVDFSDGPPTGGLAGDNLGGRGMSTIAPVTMAFNDDGDLLVCDGAKLFFNDSALVAPSSEVTTVAGAATCTSLGGYGIFNEPSSDNGTAKFYITALNNFSTVDPLDFASAESYHDNLLRVFRLGNELVLFGQSSTEFWALTGGADFPFSPITNAVLRRGIIGPLAVVEEDNTAFFVADDGLAYRIEGYRPTRISTHPVERLIDTLPLSIRSLCRAFVYTHQGSKFVNFTWVGYFTLQYNIATGLWNRAQTYGLEHWDLMGSAVASTDLYLSSSTILCELDPDQFWDDTDGTPLLIRRVARSAPGEAGGKKITVNSLTMDVEVGMTEPFNLLTYGGPDELVTAPRIMLRVARDGVTFGNELWRTMGPLGNYRKEVIWRNKGQGKHPTPEVVVSDPCRFTIMGATAELDVEP
jgi:hypothetical protein